MSNAGLQAYLLAGPTASGKTAVAHCIAQSGEYELVSADAYQIYAGMDIGTAKPAKREVAQFRYHCIDIADPRRDFNASKYRDAAIAAIRDITSRGKKALVVGGTGLYFSALLYGLDGDASADAATRAKWQAALDEGGVPALQRSVESMRPGLLARMPDPANPRRLLRVLERLEMSQDPLPSTFAKLRESAISAPALDFESAVLARRIHDRAAQMMELGLLEETRALLAGGEPLSATASASIGYAEAIAVIKGEISREEAIEKIAARTRQLAKRQRTWLRHQLKTEWFPGPSSSGDIERAASDILKHWSKHGPSKIAE